MRILIILVLVGLAGLNVGLFFFSAEFIVVISLLLFFYILFLRFGNLVSQFFFNKIEYIYFFFFELISINLRLTEFLLDVVSDITRFQFRIFNVLENRVFFLNILNFNFLMDSKIFIRILNNLLFNVFYYIFSFETMYLNKFSFDLDVEYSLYIKFYYLQGFIK
jgi:hypothetical protein